MNMNESRKKMNTPENGASKLMSKRRILKNVGVICTGYLFLFTAYQGFANLQSTMNIEGDVGVLSQSVIYVTLILSSLFLPTLVIKKLGCKMTLALCAIMYAPYVAVNFYPAMSTFVPTAALVGIAAAPLWSAKCTYINQISTIYAEQSNESTEIVISRFFGVFFMVFQNTQIWGNLVSFYVLKPKSHEILSNHSIENANLKISNVSCGASFCSGINENLLPPERDKRYMLTGIYFALIIVASLTVLILLDTLPKGESEKHEGIWSKSTATFRHMKNRNQLLLIPITVFSGIEQAFIVSDYTQAYVACAWGLHRVGLVFICFGLVNAACSFLAGKIVKYVSRPRMVMAAATSNAVVCLALLCWTPSANQYLVFFALIALWGMSDAVWQTQLNSLYGVLFRSKEEAAFSNYRLWESAGFALAFLYSTFFCIVPKIAIMLSFLGLGVIGYLFVDTGLNKEKKVIEEKRWKKSCCLYFKRN